MTFDIIRRILEDYFNYDITWVMNITDIDDKIILRARQAHLVAEHRKENARVTEGLLKELEEAWNEFVSEKLGGGEWAAIEARLLEPKETSEEGDAKKLMNFKIARQARSLLSTSKVGDDSAGVLDAFQDILAGILDTKHGASVKDPKIFRDLAAFWESEFLKDMESLNVRPASLMTRVSEFVPQIIEYVQEIIKNGYAYEAQGSVYFDVGSFGGKNDHLYAKLCPWSAGNCKFFEEGEGALGVKLSGKRDPRDFALWKAGKAGEPLWDSPWGPGRPGWHIECSAMAGAAVPGVLDVHSGGIDLAFPHHDNELAQAEAYYEMPQWVNYFLHAGHVHIEGHKMSKSLKNFITIREALEKYTFRQLRIMFLQHQWHAPVFYREDSMKTAMAVETLFINFFNNISAHLRTMTSAAPPCPVATAERELLGFLDEVRSKVDMLLRDNFDTPAVLGQLQELINRTNIYIQSQNPPNAYTLRMVGKYVRKLLTMFGVIRIPGEDSLEWESKVGSVDIWETVGPILETVSEYRDGVRAAALDKKDHKEMLILSDHLREKLTDLGVIFEDRPGKSTLVKLVNKETVARLKAEQHAKEADKLARKLEQAKVAEAKRAEKLTRAAIEPSKLFRGNPEYSQFDEQGIPTHDAKGDELGKNARKKVIKEYEVQVELHQKLLDGKL